MTPKALALKVMRQAQYGMGCMDSVYCPFCHKRTVTLYPSTDDLHEPGCVIHDLRDALKRDA